MSDTIGKSDALWLGSKLGQHGGAAVGTTLASADGVTVGA